MFAELWGVCYGFNVRFVQELKEIVTRERQKPNVRDLYSLRNLDFILQVFLVMGWGWDRCGRDDDGNPVLKGSDLFRFLFYKDYYGSSIDRLRNWAWRRGPNWEDIAVILGRTAGSLT